VVAPSEGILLAMSAALRANDTVVCMSPNYQSLSEIAKSVVGCKVVDWNVQWCGRTNEPIFLVEDLKELMSSYRVRMVVINSPHNPTGAALKPHDFEEIVAICRKHGAYLFSDEMYKGLERDPQMELPNACEYERGISLNGCSKTLSMPGIRIGWLSTNDKKIVERVEELKDFTTISPSVVSEVYASYALRNRCQIIGQNRERIARCWSIMKTFLEKNEDIFEFYEPAGGTWIFPRLRGGCHASTFVDSCYQHARVLAIPSKLFGLEEDDRIRLTFGRDETPEFVKIFDGAMEKIKQDFKRNAVYN